MKKFYLILLLIGMMGSMTSCQKEEEKFYEGPATIVALRAIPNQHITVIHKTDSGFESVQQNTVKIYIVIYSYYIDDGPYPYLGYEEVDEDRFVRLYFASTNNISDTIHVKIKL